MENIEKRLHDISTFLPVSPTWLKLISERVKSKDRIDFQDLAELISSGIPFSKTYSEITETTLLDVGNMLTKGKLTYSDFTKVINHLTDKGGQFYRK